MTKLLKITASSHLTACLNDPHLTAVCIAQFDHATHDTGHGLRLARVLQTCVNITVQLQWQL